MQTRSSVESSVCLSVCKTSALWQNGRKICPDFLYHTKDHLAWFSEKKNGWWGATPSTWNEYKSGCGWLPKFDQFFLVQRYVSGKIFMKLWSVVFCVRLLTDRQTDRETDRQTDKRWMNITTLSGVNTFHVKGMRLFSSPSLDAPCCNNGARCRQSPVPGTVYWTATRGDANTCTPLM